MFRTSDEYAEDTLRAVLTIEAGYEPGRVTPQLRDAARTLVDSCLGLLAGGPEQYRVELRRLLPLTQLELDLLGPASREIGSIATADLVERLGEWATRSPISIDERSVHVADFLGRLWPSLGLWEDREAANAMIERSTSLDLEH